MVNEVQAILDKFKADRDRKLREVKQLEEFIEQLQNMVVVVPALEMSPGVGDYAGLSLSEAASRWLVEVNKPCTTREIAEALRSRGVTTRSSNYVATVYASLAQNGRFKRLTDKTWWLADLWKPCPLKALAGEQEQGG